MKPKAPFYKWMILGLAHILHGVVMVVTLGQRTTELPQSVVLWIARKHSQ